MDRQRLTGPRAEAAVIAASVRWIDAFDGYGATVRTLRGFIASYYELVGAIRDIVLPNPDVRPS